MDFLSKGCYVVGLDCIHPESGNPYVFIKGYRKFSEISEAPKSLLEILKKKSTVVTKINHKDPDCQDDNKKTVERYVKYLKKADPAVEGSNGDTKTYWVCCRGRDLSLSEGKILELILEHYNPRCKPPWKAEDIQTKVESAFKYAKGDKGQALAQYDFPKVNGSRPTNQIHWDQGKIFPFTLLKTLNNTINYMYVGTKGEKSPLKDTLVFNEFNGQIRYVKPLPWQKPTRRKASPDGKEWSDDDSVRLKAYMSNKCEYDITRTVIEEAITEVAHRKNFHPVKEWLQKLKWDGEKRIESYLIDYAGADDNEYVRTVSKITLLQAVARIFDPGCQADTVLVLEGAQGIGKSALVKMLGGSFYADIKLDPSNKDTVDAMRGRWVIEISEMAGKGDIQMLKAFITRKTDLIRPAYGRRTIELPRQSVFIGTINLDALGEYLTDSTGNRRWLPVYIKQLKFKKFENIVPQLWAEAVDAYENGDESYIIDPAVAQMAMEEQLKRQATDSWLDKIADYLDVNENGHVTSMEIWEFMGGKAPNFSNYQAKRISECLRQLDWIRTKKRTSKNEKPRWVFIPAELSPNLSWEDMFK